jgi:hypothetical protein
MSPDERPEQQAAPSTGAEDVSPTAAADAAAVSAATPAARPADEARAPAGEAPASVVAVVAEAATTTPDTGHPGVPALAGVRDDLTTATLLALLRTTFADGRAHHWSACLEALGPIRAGLPPDLDGRSEGRVWGARAEIRWQAAGAGGYSALYLGEGEALPEGFQPLAGDLRALPSAEAEGLFLWGTRGADGQYRDPRLPRPLDYAGLGATAPEARVPCHLLVDAAGQVRFIRLVVAEEPG